MLARGKVRFVEMSDTWQQNGEGIATFVAMLPGVLRSMLGGDATLPRVIVSDRGPGFYQSSTGHIVGAYKNAAQEHGFRPYAGDDASGQPPDIPDVLLHETAVAWARYYFRKHPLKKGAGIEAMQGEFRGVLRECAQYINQHYEVDKLCRSFPERLAELANTAKGGRLNH